MWLLGDHLGSTSQAANFDGTPYPNGKQLYKAWGEKRYPTGASGLPTTYRFTGQREESALGLYWYGSRWYDSYLNRWTSPDSIIPEAVQGVQAWDRYAYANNNPVRFNDPTGHCVGPLLLVCIGVTLIGGVVSIAAINTGIDQVAWASSKTKTIAQEQAATQQWQDNCMGQCHYTNSVSPTPGVTIGAQRPDTPVSDTLALGYYNIGQGAVGLAGSIAGLTRLGLTAAQPASATTTLTSQQLDDLATDVSD